MHTPKVIIHRLHLPAVRPRIQWATRAFHAAAGVAACAALVTTFIPL